MANHQPTAAERLREDPAFVEALVRLETQYRTAWQTSKPDEHALRERLYLKLQALHEVGHAIANEYAEVLRRQQPTDDN